MKNLKVRNFYSKSGNPVANQFKIYTNKGAYFQSYNSIIAFIPNGNKPIELDEYYWDYSQTTGKYRNDFLGEYIKETREKIKDGIYKLTNLNK